MKKPLPAFMMKGKAKPESAATAKKELAFMKAKGAPKSMIAHEKVEAKGKSGAKAPKKMMGGGSCK